ncbi:MAG TPA: Hsp33 family molecular chaperone HslO [Polyangiales bacterium]|nr:Hsp33 family molecular chaperone HslO [Polyangiales bacterium]
MTQTSLGDSALRAMTNDGAFRAIVVRTTDTVQALLRAQKVAGSAGEHLGELATGAVLVRETMAPDYRLQALMRVADSRTRLVADSHPDGGTRGLVSGHEANQTLSLAGGTLEIVRTLFSGDLHRGVVEVPEGGGMSEALMAYLQTSEQVASMVSVACVLDGERVVAAGGYLVQLLPEVGRGPLAIMAERLRDFAQIGPLLARSDAAPHPLLDELFYGMEFTRLDESPLCWKCRCDTVRVMSSLATLSKADLNELISAGRTIELSCDFCGQNYNVSPSQLVGLLEQS